ncbi:hypothetical protein XF14_20980 [Burkholderia gladioli]|nr:hypothetical protein XF14_20980 [Burkholderia gladioli]
MSAACSLASATRRSVVRSCSPSAAEVMAAVTMLAASARRVDSSWKAVTSTRWRSSRLAKRAAPNRSIV